MSPVWLLFDAELSQALKSHMSQVSTYIVVSKGGPAGFLAMLGVNIYQLPLQKFCPPPFGTIEKKSNRQP